MNVDEGNEKPKITLRKPQTQVWRPLNGDGTLPPSNGAHIISQSTSDKTMDIDPILLSQTKTTRLLFYPKWVEVSDNPLRGGFLYQRKGPYGEWEDFPSKKMSSLHKDEEYRLHLDGKEMAVLFESLEEIKRTLEKYGHSYGVQEFDLVEENVNKVIIDLNNVENRDLVKKGLSELDENSFAGFGDLILSAKFLSAIDFIRGNMDNDCESDWENFFIVNPWLFQFVFSFPVYYLQDETYVGGKSTKGRQGQGGVATDFLLKNAANNSFAVVEIKPPTAALVGKQYRGDSAGGENTCYVMSSDLTGALVQLENQGRVAVKSFAENLGDDFPELNTLAPVGILIIGDKKGLGEEQERSFNLFRKAVSGSIILTYDELLAKLVILKGIYDE